MRVVYEEGDIAIVTTRGGKKFVAIYALAPGSGYYFWYPVIEGSAPNEMSDPEVSFEVIGKEL